MKPTAIAAPARMEPARLLHVDALRAIAMLGVVLLHCHLLPCGWLGVWLFYAISGFVVTLSVIERDSTTSRGARLRDFIRRRAARILPLYYGFITLGLAAGLLLRVPQHPASIAALIGFYDNVAIIAGGGRIVGWPSGHLWTISVEMQFYLVYGAMLCVLPRRITHGALVAMVAGAPLARFAVSRWLQLRGWPALDAAFAVYAGPLLHVDTFAMGALLALSYHGGGLRYGARPLLLAGMIAIAAYAAAYLAVDRLVRGEHGVAAAHNILSGILFGEYREVVLYSAVGLIMAGVVAAAANRDRMLAPLLGSPVLQWIGGISYGGYVLHAPALHIAAAILAGAGIGRHGIAGHVGQFVIGLPLTLLLAWMSFRWFETPMRRRLTSARQIPRDALHPVRATAR